MNRKTPSRIIYTVKEFFIMGKRMKKDRSHYLFDNKMLVALIIPLIIEQTLAILVGMADSIMIASVGEAAVSGVSLVDNIMVLLMNLFGALATGGAIVAGQYLGQKNEGQAKKAINQLVWFVTFLAIIVAALVYAGHNLILHGVFGQIEPDVMRHAKTYLLIVSASIPFIALYNGGAAVFRTMGNSKVTMQVSIIMNIINVVGNAILIYGFHFETAGVAIPTLLSRMVAAILIIVMLLNKKHSLHLEKTLRYRPDWEMIKRILGIGIPNSFESSMFQLGKIMVLSLVSTFGTSAIAANAVSNSVSLFHLLPGLAMQLAIPTVIARCVGAGDYEQVSYYTKKLNIITYVSMWISIGLTHLAIPQILAAYNLTAQTADVTRQILTFHAICSMILWPISFTLPCTLRAAGDAKVCMIIAVSSMWIFRIGFSYILGKYCGWGVFGVWVAMITDWIFRSICMVARYLSGKWKNKSVV